MTTSADIVLHEHEFILSGDLNFSNVMSVYEKSLAQIQAGTALVFDFAQLQSSDSSGIALIIEWMRFAKVYGKRVAFKNLSKDLIALAQAANLDVIIGE